MMSSNRLAVKTSKKDDIEAPELAHIHMHEKEITQCNKMGQP